MNPLTRRIRSALALLLTLAALMTAATASAQDVSAVTLTAEPAFEGHFKYGEWLPIWVTLENDGPDIEGEVRAVIADDQGQNTYSTPVSLAHGARKRLPLYILPNNFSHQIKVEFVQGEQVLRAQTVSVRPQINFNYLIGTAAGERGALSLLAGIRLPGGRQPVIVDVSPEMLPTRMEGMRSLDALILNAVDTSSLTARQITALGNWVRQGGHLILGGGAGAGQTVAGLPPEWLPLTPRDLVELDSLTGLSDFAGGAPVQVPGPFLAATGEPRGYTLAAQDGIPLVQAIRLGEGQITFVALDVSGTPFDAWAGTSDFWERLLSPGAAYPPNTPTDASPRQITAGIITAALTNIPNLALPSVRGIALLLGLYILLVGPVNYLVLRRRNKLHWGWITIPALTLVFTVLSFGIGYARRGSDLLVHKIAILHGYEDGSARVSSYIGVFSPASRRYDVEVLGETLPGPLPPPYDPWDSRSIRSSSLTFEQSSPAWVRGLGVEQWSMQGFMTEGTVDDFGVLHADLRVQGTKLLGTVTNQSSHPLMDVTVAVQTAYQQLRDLPPGGSAQVSLSLRSLESNLLYGNTLGWTIYDYSVEGANASEIEFKRTVLDAALGQNRDYFFGPPGDTSLENASPPGVVLFGWLANAPPELRIDGESSHEDASALYLRQIPLQFPESGAISVPPGLIPVSVAEKPATAYACGSMSASIQLSRGSAVFEFALPPELADVEVHTLNLVLRADSSDSISKLELYDWGSAGWQMLPAPRLGTTEISDPQPYLSPNGRVRVRLSVDQTTDWGACYAAALGLEGER